MNVVLPESPIPPEPSKPLSLPKPGEPKKFRYFPTGPGPEYAQPYSARGDRVVEVAAQIAEIRNMIQDLQTKDIPRKVSDVFYDWQQIGFGPERTKHGADTFRGYLMIEPESLHPAMQRLLSVGQERTKVGKRLEFKWLQPTENTQGRGTHKDHHFDCGYIGNFESQLVTVYGDSPEEIQDIFGDLIQTGWSTIELTKRTIAGKWLNPKPMKGQRRFTLPDETTWNTLEFNLNPGTEEQISPLRLAK